MSKRTEFYKKDLPFYLDGDEDFINELAFVGILNRYKLKAMNMFKWKNLPPNIEEHFIEEMLFNYGTCGFMYDKEHGYLLLKVNAWNYMDINYRPVQATLTGMGYFAQRDVYWGEKILKTALIEDKPVMNKENACVMIKNNDMYASTYSLIAYKLYQLYNVERKTDMHLDQLSLQNLLTASTQDKANIQALFKQIKRNKSYNVINVSGMKEPPSVLDLKIDFSGRELQEMKKSIEGDIHIMLGLNNVNFEKKERLITDEAKANDETTENELDLMYRCRKEACDRINELFGLNIDVEINKKSELEAYIQSGGRLFTFTHDNMGGKETTGDKNPESSMHVTSK